MWYLAAFIFVFIVLFWQSRSIAKALWRLGYYLTGKQNATAGFVAFILYPGTLIHELAHLLTAGLLMVHVGEIELTPEIRDGGVKLGSVEIGQTDPFRRALIGVAPVLWGIGLILATLSFFVNQLNPWSTSFVWWQALILCYLLFVVGNTMFSSKKDLEGTLGLTISSVVVLCLIYVILYWIPFVNGNTFLAPYNSPFIFINSLFTEPVKELLKIGIGYLLIPVILNSIILMLAYVVKMIRR